MKSENTIIISGILLLIALIIVGAYAFVVPSPVGELLTGDFKEIEEKSDLILGPNLTGSDDKTQMQTQDSRPVSPEKTYPSRNQEFTIQHGENIESSTKTADQVSFCDSLSEQDQLSTQCKIR